MLGVFGSVYLKHKQCCILKYYNYSLFEKETFRLNYVNVFNDKINKNYRRKLSSILSDLFDAGLKGTIRRDLWSRN